MACSLLDNRDLNLPAAGRCSDACVEIKLEFPLNASWVCPEVVYFYIFPPTLHTYGSYS